MDAVRWVLGESKASELRGESMQDVIFNGSSDRKPAARASVELVFDNSLGRIGGSWGSFAELSVKRLLTRDGQSSYFINNQSVRRRDVHDMFLGTGLGPRAYAIIGQGMISRIIEARPEELRVFLEEAAGVSKYKERRRETENRLNDTRENLTRVEDILRELGAQIDKLERQAEVARQYRELEADRDRKQHMLWLVRRDEADADRERNARLSAEAVNQLEAKIAELRALEAELEAMRADHYAASDEMHAAQGRFYDANSEATRLESEIRYVAESQQQMRARAAALVEQASRAASDAAEFARRIEDSHLELEESQARVESLEQNVAELSQQLPELESRVRQERAAHDEARTAAMATRQAIEVAAIGQRTAQSTLSDATRRRERLEAEAAGVEAPPTEAIEAMTRTLASAETEEQATAEALEAADAQWRAADAERAPSQQALREAEAKVHQIEARIATLRQIQDRVQSQGKVAPWLSRHGLDRLGRFWQRLRIEHGWETAVESVLRERTSALEVGQLEHVAGLVADAPPAKVSFFAPALGQGVQAPVAPGLRTLLTHLHVGDAGVQSVLSEWLHGFFVAESVEDAVSRRGQLPAGGAFVVPEGHVVDRHSIRIYAPDSEQDGVLARQFELDNLAREQRAQHLLADEARSRVARAEAAASQAVARLNAAREAHNRAVRQLSTVRVDAERLEQARQRASLARDRLESELEEVMQVLATVEQTLAEEADRFERLDLELAERQQRAEELSELGEQAEAALARHRDALRQAERESQEAAFRSREIQSSIERFTTDIEQARRLGEQAAGEQAQIEARLAELSDTGAREALQGALEARGVAEQALSAARQRLDELTQALRARDERRLELERAQEPLRQRATELQIKEQAARLNVEQFAEQIVEHQVDEAAVRAAFQDAPKPSWLQGEVTRLGNAIAALGAVNLAALDELNESRERKGFLDAQSADLNEAIETLEDAIRKIDRETRDVLQKTYDTVNGHFGQLFPELFGGGEARLVLTGDEILDAGIQVMAHPPGKRNASIHLLSGGEKALTAIALVFALFQLNPAPFCLLDEVDAPLDDANTERYADMVRRMSDQTQFLFITHNKIAMEMAQQLVGVTMQERGVSRIVAVDLESAAQMAEAA